MLWHCWLGGRKGIRSVKNWVVGCWHGYLSEATCRCHCHSLSRFSKIQTGFNFLVPAHPGSPGQGAVKQVCVCVCFVIMACIVLCLDLSIGWVSFWWGPLSGTTQVSRYQKGKTNHDFTGARDSEWQWHQLGHMQVCTSLQTDNHASTSLYSVFYRPDALPAAQPTASKHWRGPTSWQTCYSCGGLLIICQIALKISDFDKFSS